MNSELLDGMQPQPAAQREAGSAGGAAGAAERYLEGIRALHREAVQCGEIVDFVAAVTRTLAWIAFVHDSPAVTGDILRRIGTQLVEFAERERAQRELAALRKAGGEAN